MFRKCNPSTYKNKNNDKKKGAYKHEIQAKNLKKQELNNSKTLALRWIRTERHTLMQSMKIKRRSTARSRRTGTRKRTVYQWTNYITSYQNSELTMKRIGERNID